MMYVLYFCEKCQMKTNNRIDHEKSHSIIIKIVPTYTSMINKRKCQ